MPVQGKPDPGAPQRADKERKRTYKTKDEVNKTRGLTSTIVLVLLFISVAVPMLQYWGYTSKDVTACPFRGTGSMHA